MPHSRRMNHWSTCVAVGSLVSDNPGGQNGERKCRLGRAQRATAVTQGWFMPKARVTERMQVATPPAPPPVTITFRPRVDGTDIDGTDIDGADLDRADLDGAARDERRTRVLPDGQLWVPDPSPAVVEEHS